MANNHPDDIHLVGKGTDDFKEKGKQLIMETIQNIPKGSFAGFVGVVAVKENDTITLKAIGAGPQPALEFMARWLAEDLNTNLGRVPETRVN